MPRYGGGGHSGAALPERGGDHQHPSRGDENPGNRPGRAAFLAFYELASLDPLASDAWQEAAWGTERSQKMRPRLQDMIRKDYWLHFTQGRHPGGGGKPSVGADQETV